MRKRNLGILAKTGRLHASRNDTLHRRYNLLTAAHAVLSFIEQRQKLIITRQNNARDPSCASAMRNEPRRAKLEITTLNQKLYHQPRVTFSFFVTIALFLSPRIWRE